VIYTYIYIYIYIRVLYGLTFLNTSRDAAGVFFFFVLAFEFFDFFDDFFDFSSTIRRVVVDWCSSSNSKRLGWVNSLLPSATTPPERRMEADSRK